MIKEKIFFAILSLAILLATMTSASLAAVIVGQRVTFDPAAPRPGETVTPVVHFQVEGGPVNLSLSYGAVLPSSGATVVGTAITGTFPTGTNTARLSRFTISDPAPHEICFSIFVKIAGGTGAPQLLIERACLKRDIRVASTGTGERGVLPDLASGTLPDLVIVRPELNTKKPSAYLGAGEATVQFSIANLGGRVAEGVEWKVVINFDRCVRWDYNPGGLDRGGLPPVVAKRVGSIPRIAPGQSVFVNVKFNETVMTYIDSGQTQRWVSCDIYGAKIVVDPNNRIREGNEDNTFIFPRSRTPINE
ncbi:MAG TPA: CARDB domain-containing protein [Acidobacteriota bacterium]